MPPRQRVHVPHQHVSTIAGVGCLPRAFIEVNARMNVTPNVRGVTNNFYIVQQSYRNAGGIDHTTMCKCNLSLTHGCPFMMRVLFDTRGDGQVHLFELGAHRHDVQIHHGVGLSFTHRALLIPFLTGGGLRPMDAMRILGEANGGIVDTGGRSNQEFRVRIVGPYLQRYRRQECSAIGDSYAEILQFSKTYSLFLPGWTFIFTESTVCTIISLSDNNADKHQMGCIFAMVGTHVMHGAETSTSPSSAINHPHRRRWTRRDGVETRTTFIVVLTSRHLLQLLGSGEAWNQLGEKVSGYQDDVINNVTSEQYPYHFGGTSDIRQKFHPVTLSAISHETEVSCLLFSFNYRYVLKCIP